MRIKGLTSPFLGDLIFLNASDESEEKMGSEKMIKKKYIFFLNCVYSLMADAARSEAFCFENGWDAFCLAGMSGSVIH